MVLFFGIIWEIKEFELLRDQQKCSYFNFIILTYTPIKQNEEKPFVLAPKDSPQPSKVENHDI